MKNKDNQQKSDYWLGIIYFNRKDSRVIVPKRVTGLGWTLNFANPYTYIIIIAIVSIIIGYSYLS
jgi:uncharacterized membrane protein